ncbi:hypothetical protein HKX48_007122 [Thoreauomyces humboldtii]|nr:hypothetical protein HKX48_007122 [Thoreauomyces humboldtii]
MLTGNSSRPHSTTTATTTDNQKDPSQTHPKIQTESKHDIAFLKTLLKHHAAASLQPHAAATPAVRTLEPHIDNWLEGIFSLASYSILVNGLPYAKALEKTAPEYEPLDEACTAELEATRNRVVESTVRVARLRKEGGREVANVVERDMQARRTRETDVKDEEEEEVGTNVEAGDDGDHLVPTPPISILLPMLTKSITIPCPLIDTSLPTLTAKLGRAVTVIDDLRATQAASSSSSSVAGEGKDDPLPMGKRSSNHASPTGSGRTSPVGRTTPRTARAGLLNAMG